MPRRNVIGNVIRGNFLGVAPPVFVGQVMYSTQKTHISTLSILVELNANEASNFLKYKVDTYLTQK